MKMLDAIGLATTETLEKEIDREIARTTRVAARWAEEYHEELSRNLGIALLPARVVIFDDAVQRESDIPHGRAKKILDGCSYNLESNTIYLDAREIKETMSAYVRSGRLALKSTLIDVARIATITTLFHEYGHASQGVLLTGWSGFPAGKRKVYEKNADYQSGNMLAYVIKRGNLHWTAKDQVIAEALIGFAPCSAIKPDKTSRGLSILGGFPEMEAEYGTPEDRVTYFKDGMNGSPRILPRVV